jgi:hypothetical protein
MYNDESHGELFNDIANIDFAKWLCNYFVHGILCLKATIKCADEK